MVRVQPTAATSPDQSENRQPALALAVSVTTVPGVYSGPTGSAVTTPLPAGSTAVVSLYCAAETKVAVTALSLSMVTAVSVVAGLTTSPTQRSNRQPSAGVAVTVSTIPYVAVAVTGSALPLPGGATCVVRVYRIWVKVAVTALSPSMVNLSGLSVGSVDGPP